MTSIKLQVALVATLILGVSTTSNKEQPLTQPGRSRPSHVAGWIPTMVERAYKVQEKSGSDEAETETNSRSQQSAPEHQHVLRQHYQNYARALEQQQRYVSSSQQRQEELVRQQQQEELLRQQQQLQLLQQYQQVPYQAQQQKQQLPLQFQQFPYQQQQIPQGYLAQQQLPQGQDFQQHIQLLQQQRIQQIQQQQQQQQQLRAQQPQQPLQQQVQAGDSVTSSVSFLGVKYSSAPAVAHTMFQTNNGVRISY